MSRNDRGGNTATTITTTPGPKTPNRTPQRSATTPNRTPTRTPTQQRSFFNPKTIVRPTPPDFTAMSANDSIIRKSVLGKRSDDSFVPYNPEKEPIKAYLRIRPQPVNHEAMVESPYLQVVDDLEVSMTPPEDSNAYRTRNRAPERYKFTKIFTDSVTQQDFFNKTTLPLVRDVLTGENALVFAYGVTNSGKTYSVMGTKKERGILPRTLDVIFNSVDGYISESKNPNLWEGYHLPAERDQTILDIGQKFEYGIWVSFAEIYTEKIYDLLVPPNKQLKRQSLSLKYEFRSGHKYISGLTEVSVQSIEEAYALLHESQKNRAVYSTLLNHTSSRSHSIFTVRIVRTPIDDEDYVIEDPAYATVSKMSIVDLAGSERYRNTFNTGQRLKEAGNINKSLMVLGQCMETLRLNQIKTEMGKRAAIVPFRHSKLTELFKSSFEGDGKAVMVVNVNPFDTGFDENSHVMKFAAVAKNVATWRRIHPKLDLHGISGSAKRLRTQSYDKQRVQQQQQQQLQQYQQQQQQQQQHHHDEEDEDESDDPFVDNLIIQLEDLHGKWIEAETRCATIESTVRQQVAKETETELRKMEDIYMSALKSQSLTAEMDRLRAIMRDHEATKHSLLEKIAELEGDKRREQDTNRQLTQQLREREQEQLKRPAPAALKRQISEMDVDTNINSSEHKDPKFQEMLELRKRLRRSVFKNGKEYAEDAGDVMKQVEEFEGVTFELIKETTMGRLLKLIAQRKFASDPAHIQERATRLFKRFARLSIDVLAPAKGPRSNKNNNRHNHTVMVSVDAGREEELISDMRVALETLQHENMKLKSRVKAMHVGQRRLKQAFEKTKNDVSIASSVAQPHHHQHQQENYFEPNTASAQDPEPSESTEDVSTCALLNM
ncbi:kinesin motor domain-containing protein [Zychaea mexicana]|uniref:kinesin motor domain-containing protein n=1 Tax=Zychaea mexicana TaxID=64656 RepID=UPI0022FE1A59|nr:kinesin motor domain-containing protein [Zychaea mexicana]KAI9484744.1 kinesin motor domain-containing protein [Zychaea mexicana]